MTNIELFQPNKYPLSNGIRLIEASAGTGKTFSLSHLVLRLLTEKEYSINEILVVSFTEATASEIKARIIERLILALKIIESINTFCIIIGLAISILGLFIVIKAFIDLGAVSYTHLTLPTILRV